MTVRQVVQSILMVLAVVCLIAGVAMAAEFVVTEAGDPAGSVGEALIAVVMGLLVYGPMMVVTGWPASVPVVVVAGLLVGYLWPRYQRRREPSTPGVTARVAGVILLGYGGLVCLAFLALLLHPR